MNSIMAAKQLMMYAINWSNACRRSVVGCEIGGGKVWVLVFSLVYILILT